MAKHVLHSTGDELDFALIGISSADDQYLITSLLNDTLGVSLYLSEYLKLNLKAGHIFSFSLYRYVDEGLGLEYLLVPNASNFEDPGVQTGSEDLFAGQEVEESTRLVKELPKTDYLLLLKGEMLEHYKFRVISSLRNSGHFAQVQGIDPLTLQSRKNLIF